MSEPIIAEVISGKKPVEITVNKLTPINAGKEPKKHLEVTVAGRQISLVERNFDQRYVENWKAFRQAGLPVAPTLRKSSRETLLVTDVKADGSEVYGNASYHQLQLNKLTEGKERERPRPEIDKLFLQITDPAVFSAVEAKARKYLAIANENKIRLPYDDPFELIIHPDGSWDLTTLDLTEAGKLENDFSSLIIKDTAEKNEEATKAFLTLLRKIRRQLEKKNKTKKDNL